MLDLTPDQVLTTTRTVRRRLDFGKRVERSLIEECLERKSFRKPALRGRPARDRSVR